MMPCSDVLPEGRADALCTNSMRFRVALTSDAAARALPGGEQDPLALHAALPVGAGAEKFVSQQWVADWVPGPGAAAPAAPAVPDGRALARVALKRSKGGSQGGAEGQAKAGFGKAKAGFGARKAPSKVGGSAKTSKKPGKGFAKSKGFGR